MPKRVAGTLACASSEPLQRPLQLFLEATVEHGLKSLGGRGRLLLPPLPPLPATRGHLQGFGKSFKL